MAKRLLLRRTSSDDGKDRRIGSHAYVSSCGDLGETSFVSPGVEIAEAVDCRRHGCRGTVLGAEKSVNERWWECDLDDTTCGQKKTRLDIVISTKECRCKFCRGKLLEDKETVCHARRRRHRESTFRCPVKHTLPVRVEQWRCLLRVTMRMSQGSL